MAMIKCPNCGKNTYDDDKCIWCKFLLKEKKHSFDAEKYDLLKNEYLTTPYKSLVIKVGLEKYGMDLTECKRIVDYIANEDFEINDYKSNVKEQQFKSGIYKFSFFQYFIRNFLYKILIAMILLYFMKNAESLTATLFFLVVFGVWCITSLYALTKATTYKIVFEPNKIEFSRRSSTFTAPGGRGYEGRMTGIHFEDRMDKEITYRILLIENTTSSLINIKIKGRIQYKVLKLLTSGRNRVLKDKEVGIIKIPKYFKNNSEIVSRLMPKR